MEKQAKKRLFNEKMHLLVFNYYVLINGEMGKK